MKLLQRCAEGTRHYQPVSTLVRAAGIAVTTTAPCGQCAQWYREHSMPGLHKQSRTHLQPLRSTTASPAVRLQKYLHPMTFRSYRHPAIAVVLHSSKYGKVLVRLIASVLYGMRTLVYFILQKLFLFYKINSYSLCVLEVILCRYY